MESSRLFTQLAKLTLLFTYLIVLAGGFVRMTGSGMGCPDWPKCFGVWIPPVSVDQITWKKHTNYQDNQILINYDTLWVAKHNFNSSNNFNRKNWEVYKKHNYTKFNVFQTWTEYVNRCIGAITGIFVMALFFISLFKPNMFREYIASLVLLILFGLQAWIGGEVVFSVLNPFKITIHMFVALIIVCVLFVLIHFTRKVDAIKIVDYQKNINFLLILTLGFSLIQIFFGTQVREFVDTLVVSKLVWSLELERNINIHQLIAVCVCVLNVFLFISIAGKHSSIKKIPIELVFIVIALSCLIFSGIIMLNFNFPGLSQLIHLVSAFILFGAQFNLFLKINFRNPI